MLAVALSVLVVAVGAGLAAAAPVRSGPYPYPCADPAIAQLPFCDVSRSFAARAEVSAFATGGGVVVAAAVCFGSACARPVVNAGLDLLLPAHHILLPTLPIKLFPRDLVLAPNPPHPHPHRHITPTTPTQDLAGRLNLTEKISQMSLNGMGEWRGDLTTPLTPSPIWCYPVIPGPTPVSPAPFSRSSPGTGRL